MAFQPYEQNGGSALAIAGPNFVVIGADTRLCGEVSIFSRHQNKVHELTKQAVIATTGCYCDGLNLLSILRTRIENYTETHLKNMTTESLAQMVSVIMYNQRFLPYSVMNIVAGLDQDGKGATYSYDSVGHFQRHPFCSIGTGGPIMMPVLDGLIGTSIDKCFKKTSRKSEHNLLLAEKIVEEAFITASHRDLYTADNVIMKTITSEGICTKQIPLPKN